MLSSEQEQQKLSDQEHTQKQQHGETSTWNTRDEFCYYSRPAFQELWHSVRVQKTYIYYYYY